MNITRTRIRIRTLMNKINNTAQIITIDGLTVLSDTRLNIELRTVGKLLSSCKSRPDFEIYFD